MMSSNGNIFRVTDHLCGEFTSHPTQRPVTWSFDVFCDLCLNKRLSKQPWGCDLRGYRAYYDVIVIPWARYGSAFCDLGKCLQLEFRFNTYWHQIYSYLEWQGVVRHSITNPQIAPDIHLMVFCEVTVRSTCVITAMYTIVYTTWSDSTNIWNVIMRLLPIRDDCLSIHNETINKLSLSFVLYTRFFCVNNMRNSNR